MPPLLPLPAVSPNRFNTATAIQSSQVSTTTGTSDNGNSLASASISSTSDAGTSRDRQSNSSSLHQPGNNARDQRSNTAASQNNAADAQAANPSTQRPTQVQDPNERSMQIKLSLSLNGQLKLRPLRSPFFDLDGDRASQTERPLRLPLPVNNSVGANVPLPPNWNENMKSVYQSVDPYKLFPVHSWTLEFRKLAKLLDPLSISGIQQIVNPAVWKRFVNARNEMMIAKSADPLVLKELGLSDQEIVRKQQSLNFFRHSEVDEAPYDDNFALLFHCTKDPANVEPILRYGFDERMSNGGMLGKAIYFSDEPRKSIEYDRCDGVIFVCGVLLGDCFRFNCKDSVRRSIARLVRGPEKLPAERRTIDDHYFDSVNGNFKSNEYAVYNRFQCYPLYQVTYSKIATKYANGFCSEFADPPPFGWQTENEVRGLMPYSTWPLFAKNVFDEMDSVNEPSSQQSIDRQLEMLQYRGHADRELNLRTLEENNYHLGMTMDALFQRNIDEVKKLMKLRKGEIAANKNKSIETLDHLSTVDDIPKKRQMLTSAAEADKKPLVSLEPTDEFCFVCWNSYSKTSNDCTKLLQCEHKVCAECYKKIEITRETMTGVSHTSIKCPFCQLTAGITIGICPNGEMSDSIIPSHCEGYEDCDTIMIMYEMKTPMESSAGANSSKHSSDECLHSSVVRRRQAFLPNNPEGQSILNLLRTAWDRRIIFTIGTSYTTGRDNSLVWNIHHKTSQTGGSYCHGYPDATYLKRVRAELKSYGIE